MPRRDRLNDAPPHDLIGQLTVAPLADRSVGVCGLLARQSDNLAHLLRRELCRRTLPWGIGQPLRHAEVIHGYLSKLQPALPPEARRLVIQSEPSRDLRIVPPIASREDDPCARHQLLTRSVVRTKHSKSTRSRSLSTTSGGRSDTAAHNLNQSDCCILTGPPSSPVVFRPRVLASRSATA